MGGSISGILQPAKRRDVKSTVGHSGVSHDLVDSRFMNTKFLSFSSIHISVRNEERKWAVCIGRCWWLGRRWLTQLPALCGVFLLRYVVLHKFERLKSEQFFGVLTLFV